MESEWYYAVQGQQQGPVSSGELRQLVTSGRIQPSDMVWKQGMTQWVAAINVTGLFPAGTQAPPPIPPLPPVLPTHLVQAGTTATPLRDPAIGLIVAGGILAIYNFFFTILTGPRVFSAILASRDDRGRGALLLLFFFAFLLSLLSLAAGGFAMFAGIQMLHLSRYRICFAGSIAGIVGGALTGLPGWVLVVPFAVWALVALRRPENKKLFLLFAD